VRSVFGASSRRKRVRGAGLVGRSTVARWPRGRARIVGRRRWAGLDADLPDERLSSIFGPLRRSPESQASAFATPPPRARTIRRHPYLESERNHRIARVEAPGPGILVRRLMIVQRTHRGTACDRSRRLCRAMPDALPCIDSGAGLTAPDFGHLAATDPSEAEPWRRRGEPRIEVSVSLLAWAPPAPGDSTRASARTSDERRVRAVWASYGYTRDNSSARRGYYRASA